LLRLLCVRGRGGAEHAPEDEHHRLGDELVIQLDLDGIGRDQVLLGLAVSRLTAVPVDEQGELVRQADAVPASAVESEHIAGLDIVVGHGELPFVSSVRGSNSTKIVPYRLALSITRKPTAETEDFLVRRWVCEGLGPG
jgi:hypothetical protein